DFTRYRRAVQAAELGCESNEQRAALGPKLDQNLLGAGNSISVLIEQAGPRDCAAEDGANALLKFLATERFAKSSFRELPKAFDTFVDLTHFERKGEEPMAVFCAAMEVARRNLAKVGPDTKISSDELGHRALKRRGLDKDERNLVIARADETFNFATISTTLKNGFPRGGSRRRGQGKRTGWKWKMLANDTETGQADGEDQHNGEYWVQGDDCYWYEWDDDRGVYTCTEEDGADTFLAGEDDDYQQTLVTMRESRLKMNKLQAAKGFFKGGIGGAVDENAAAGGHAAGKTPGKGTGKGKDGGKSKVRDPNANYIHMQPEKDYDIMMASLDSDPIVPDRPELEVMISSDVVPAPLVDSGASIAVAGRGRLDRVEAELTKYGLMPVKEYFEIPGDMVGLTSRKDLAEWRANLYMREDGHWADFQELGVRGKDLVKLPVGATLRVVRVDEMQLEPDAFLVAETLQEYELGFQVKEHADSWVAETLKNGSKDIFKKGTLKRIDKLMKEYSVIFDALWDNLWELFAKEARFARAASKGGHANATPPDLSVGVNFSDPQTQSDFLFLTNTFDPWMVSVAFPCAPFSNMQEFQRAQGMGDRVDDLIEEFRPLVHFSAKRPPLYEMVTLHQCMFGLTDDYGTPIRKATRMLVPNGSCFPWWLDRKCEQRHEHADTVGRGTLISRASAWPDDVGRTLVSADAHEVSRRTDLKKLSTGDDATKDPDQRTMRTVAKDLKLKKDLLDVRVLRQNEAIPVPRGAVRRTYAVYTDEGVLADFSDAYADDPCRHPSPRRYHYLAADQKHSSLTIVKQTQYIETYIAKVESFGDKPSDITTAQWGALRKLHLNLSHPSAHALKRRLESYGLSQKVLDAVDKFDCVVCKELGWPNTTRSANLKLSTELNENVFMDEAEAPQLKGRVERAVDFFKDRFQRLNHDAQLTKSDDPAVCTFRGRFEQIRAATNQAFFELDCDDAVRRAAVGRVRPPRGPFVPGELAFYWREVKHVKSKRLQGDRGWRGPAIVLAAEGHARLHLSYRGVPVLVTSEQVRHASRGEAEMVENEGLVRQLSQWRGGPTLQKGFVDERGPGPDGGGVQRDRRRKKDDGDSDKEGAVGDAPCYPKYHHYLEMETTCRTLEMKIHPEMETTCKMLRLTTHLYLMQLGRGAPRTWARLLCQAIRSNNLSKKDSQNLHHSLVRGSLYKRSLPDDSEANRERFCARREALKQSRLPMIEDDEIDDKVLFLEVKNRSRDAFVARRTDAAKDQVNPKKGRELRSISPEWKTAFEASDLEEWRKWMQYDALERPSEEEISGAEKADILPMRRARADKNLQTNAPALTDTAAAVIIQEAASQPGWSLEQGDAVSAFLNGRYLDNSRLVYFRVPKGGVPAVPELGWPFVPEGTVLQAKKGVYGLNEAPLLLHEEHRDAILSLPGASRSKLRPALFIFHDERGKLIGLIGTHVDDDLVEHTKSIENIPISAERRKTKEAKATTEERAMLHTGNGQVQWLVRSTKMDLALWLVESQARARDSNLKVQDLLDYNKVVSNAKTDHLDITFQKLDIGTVIVVAVGDLSHGNVGKTKTASQAVESGDMLRQHLVELHGLGYRTHMDDVKAIKMVELTDCKSLYDLLQKRGTVPSEKRLLIDIESLRNGIEFNNVVSKWVNTKQMLADCITKQDVRAGDSMRYVLRTGEYRLTGDPTAEQVIPGQRTELKGRKGEYYRSKYPRRHRPADQPFAREGYAYFEDCIADL
ncbi:unnamed protein product, partial [Prorocentrum cordatum]